MAKSKGLPGYSSMRKDQPVKALVRAAKKRAAARAASKPGKSPKSMHRRQALKAHAAHSNGAKAHSPAKANGSARANGTAKANGKHQGTSRPPTARQQRIAERI